MHHKSKAIHVQVLMSGHNPQHHVENRGGSSSSKPCDVLMRQQHYAGGITNSAQHYAKGGKADRAAFATGGHVDHESTGGTPKHHHRRRKNHADGGHEEEENVTLMSEPKSSKKGNCSSYAEGGEADKNYGEKPLTGQLRKGGRARRQRHYWGQSVIGRLPLVGGIANSIANTVGTLDPNKYGGSNYTAKTGGQKAADIFSTIGNLGASLLSAKGGAKKSKGGEVHHNHRHNHAAGGSGKVRKGMMTKSGHMIHHDI